MNDAAARVPNTAAGERLLYPVISKGSSEIQGILTRSHDDLSTIAGRIHGLSGEYQALGDGDGGAGKGGTKVDKLPKTPDTTLDLDDIVHRPPFVPGDGAPTDRPNCVEIGPGTWLPRNDFPGVAPSPPKAPLDYRGHRVSEGRRPNDPRPSDSPGRRSSFRGRCAWVPDPNYPGIRAARHPRCPWTWRRRRSWTPDSVIPAGMVELYPGSRVAIPDPNRQRASLIALARIGGNRLDQEGGQHRLGPEVRFARRAWTLDVDCGRRVSPRRSIRPAALGGSRRPSYSELAIVRCAVDGRRLEPYLRSPSWDARPVDRRR